MNKALAFKLKGDFACFRDFSETGKLFPTTQIPNPLQLSGLLGAILGFSGYGKVSDINKYTNDEVNLPEFYEKLKGIEYAICQDINCFESKIEIINNHTGLYFTKGQSMQIMQEFLINPEYKIYIRYSDDYSEIYNDLKTRLKNKESEYQVYLGKPELFADIEFIGEYPIENISNENIKIDNWISEELIEGFVEERISLGNRNSKKFKNKTSLFTDIFEKTLIKKDKKTFIFTNNLISKYDNECFQIENNKISFNKI